MGSRANKSARELKHYGAPMSTPKPSKKKREKPEQSAEERREAIKRYQAESIQEGRNKKSSSKEPRPTALHSSGTKDLTASMAAERISGRKRQLDEAERKALGK